MKTGSVKANYALNLINTVSGLLFPLITFPYASRVLMAEGIGQVQFFDSIIGYILLVTSLGIPLYAVRELARVRGDLKERSKVATEIILLHAMLTFVAYIIVFIIATTVTKVKADVPLFLLLSSSLLFTAIGVQWFYQAMEDFKYITIRSIAIKALAAVALFVFVKEKDDILWYAAVNTGASVGNNLFNFIRLRKHISLKGLSFGQLQIVRHLRPSLKLFALNMIVSIYILLDSVMLGFLSGEEAVGFYTAANKLTRMSLGIVTSLGAVLLPRFSNYISTGRYDEFKELGGKAISFTAALVFPMTAGLVLLAEPVITVFSGPTYGPSVLTLQILAPVTIFLGFSGLLGMQMLYPQGKETLVMCASGAGALINLIMNLLLIPHFAQWGAAFSSAMSECTVLVVILLLGYRYLPFRFFTKQNMVYLAGTALMSAAVLCVRMLDLQPFAELAVSMVTGVAVYALFLIICKDHFVQVVFGILFKRKA